MKKIIAISYFTFIAILCLMLLCNAVVYNASKGNLYRDVKSIPENKVGLVLGTSKYLAGGRLNLYFHYRMKAAAELYRQGKIKYILVSGDNSTNRYNEPKMMQEELVEMGIPKTSIYLDYAGFRTLDSVVRAKEVFGQSSITIISQDFHNKRAIYIAEKSGIKAVGYDAQDVSSFSSFRTKLRETFARVLVFMDVNILKRQPKFLGDQIEIG